MSTSENQQDRAGGSLVTTLIAAGIAFFVVRTIVAFAFGGGVLGEGAVYAQEIRAGFEEVSDDWDEWWGEWRNLSDMEFRPWGAYVAVLYTTDEEVRKIYSMRSELFEVAAETPARQGICGLNALADESLDPRWMMEYMGDVLRVQGRGFARHHAGVPAWIPVLDLDEDMDAWEDFADFFDSRGEYVVLDTFFDLADELPVSGEDLCIAQATMYRLAAAEPHAPIGDATLLEFVRTLESLEIVEMLP